MAQRGVTEAKMVSHRFALMSARILLACALPPCVGRADEPKPTPENTIHIQLAAPVPPQKFAKAPKFFISEVIDRSGNAQPMLVLRERGGVFLDRPPTEIAREAIEQSLKSAGLLAADAASADLVLQIYVFHFGLAQGSGLDFFGKVEFSVMVKNVKREESQQIEAKGTSIANAAIRKKNIQKNVQANIEGALEDAVRNLVRGTQLREAVASLMKDSPNAPAAAPSGDLAVAIGDGDRGKRFESRDEKR
jgi:hypothetical protein